jgi:hypothetical protein
MNNTISNLLLDALRYQLRMERPARAWNGTPKPVSKKFPTQSGNKIVTGRLYDEMSIFWEKDWEDGEVKIGIDFGNADYWYYVNYGRKPGTKITKVSIDKFGNQREYETYTKFPPINKIKDWAKAKPVLQYRDRLGRFIDNDTRAFLIGRAIARDGIYGIKFIDAALAQVKEELKEMLLDDARQYFEDVIKKGLIIRTNVRQQ